jgi:arylsulfatase
MFILGDNTGYGDIGVYGGGRTARPMNGYPKVFNIEADPREEHNIGAMYSWVLGPLLKIVEEYKASLVKNSNAPAANMTRF